MLLVFVVPKPAITLVLAFGQVIPGRIDERQGLTTLVTAFTLRIKNP
jgi:hypothetical protein